jgi:hypothetical protein
MSSKETNPKDACGIKKAPLSCAPLPVLMELGCAMHEGAMKYGRHNYRAIGVRASVYFDAAIRHLFSWWEGEDIDPDSGVPHIVKAMACLAVIRDAQFQGKCTDDRPPRSPCGWIKELNEKAGVLVDRYPNPPAPYVEQRPGIEPKDLQKIIDDYASAREENETYLRRARPQCTCDECSG